MKIEANYSLTMAMLLYTGVIESPILEETEDTREFRGIFWIGIDDDMKVLKDVKGLRNRIRKEVISRADAAICTASVVGQGFVREPLRPGVIVCDGACQLAESHTWPLLRQMQKNEDLEPVLLLVGDAKQLPVHIRSGSIGRKDHEEYINDFAKQYHMSLFERILEAGYRFHMLRDHSRMPEVLSKLPIDIYYSPKKPMVHHKQHTDIQECHDFQKLISNRYRIPLDDGYLDAPEILVDAQDAETNQMGTSKGSPYLVGEGMELLLYITPNSKFNPEDIKVIVSYKAQQGLYREALRKAYIRHGLTLKRIGVRTIDSFQGGQAKITIIDQSYSKDGIQFVGDSHRFNMAMTRCARAFIANVDLMRACKTSKIGTICRQHLRHFKQDNPWTISKRLNGAQGQFLQRAPS